MQKTNWNRWLLTVLTLLAVVLWLFFSYVPGALIRLPVLGGLGNNSGSLFQALIVVCLGVFVFVQWLLIHSTLRILRRWHGQQTGDAQSGFRINFVAELLWTVFPLLMTLGLALVGLRTWLTLFSP